MIPAASLKTLTDLCNLPTAPYHEQHVIAYLLDWAKAKNRRGRIKIKRDPAGNVYLIYKHAPTKNSAGKPLPPLVIEAHMDHPGFVAAGHAEDGQLLAQFYGGVRPSHFKGATAAFWLVESPENPDGHWAYTKVLDAKPSLQGLKNYIEVILEPPNELVPSGTLGMWALPDAAVISSEATEPALFAARVCDDIAGLAAALCMLDELIAQDLPAHVIVMASRAEEVGFAGVLAAVQNKWVPKNARVIGIETSKAGAGGAAQGAGPIVRVGDKAGIFSPGLTHFIMQAGGAIADQELTYLIQRKLMDGGVCNSTAFTAFGYDAAGVCLALGNYHNMTVPGETGYGDGARTGEGIASETIHLQDFHNLVRLLVEVVRRYPTYKPNFGAMRERLEKLHATEQEQMLYATSDQKKQ